MDLLERFKRHTPRWENPDPAVRAEGVREDVRVEEHDLLSKIASEDPDPRVRKAAVRKLGRVADLAAALRDADTGVREVATESLSALAKGLDESVAAPALDALTDVRHLTAVAREGLLPPVRLAAVTRIGDSRPLVLLARLASDAAVRAAALDRIADSALVAEVALKGEHKTTAVAAVERLEDIQTLEAIADRAIHKAAARRARTRLAALQVTIPAEAVSREIEADGTGGSLEMAATAAEPLASESPAGAETLVEGEQGASPAPSEEPGSVVDPPAGADPVPEPEPAAPPAASAAPSVETQPDRQAEADREAAEEARRLRTARAEALTAHLEELAKSPTLALRDAEGALREARGLLSEGLPGRVEHRLRTSHTALFARAQELREADEWTRWANAAIQEEVCQALEGLAGREDLERVARDVREADRRWAEARPAPRDQAEALRLRYQAARAPLKERLDKYFAAKSVEHAEHLKLKLALCERAEALADSREWLKVAEELKTLQARWKQIGGAAPRDERAAWKRFHSACDKFFTRRQEDLRHQKETWSANLARKEELCAKAEALVDSTDWEKTAAEIRRLQAEWKEIGPVRRSRSEAIWARFRKACDLFFDRYKRRDELEASARRAGREALCAEMEALAPDGSPAPDDLATKVLALMSQARQATALPVKEEEELTRRLVAARNRLVASHPAGFRGTELDPDANRVRREKLCARVEALAASVPSEADENLAGEALARRLKEALASNTIGGRAEAEARQRAERAEVESARAAWKRLGPVPGEAGAALETRFNEACSRFLGSPRARSVASAR